jgi:hypothetical protein
MLKLVSMMLIELLHRGEEPSGQTSIERSVESTHLSQTEQTQCRTDVTIYVSLSCAAMTSRS